MQRELLPLFPLEVVLFPRTPLPLHVFEDRYKEMIGEAIRDQTEFGIVQAGEKGIMNPGCTAVVEKVLKQYPDGRMDLVASGRRRFEIILLNDEKSYLRGAVDFFDDEELDPVVPEFQQKALDGYRALVELESSAPANEPELTDPQLSFQLAQLLPDLDFRQLLLGTRSEAQRMKQLADFLPGYVIRQRRVVQMRQVAPRNGHGRHITGL